MILLSKNILVVNSIIAKHWPKKGWRVFHALTIVLHERRDDGADNNEPTEI
jgi:hypothetical protein